MSVAFQKTYRSPINNSPSKQLYSFSKADRFEPTRRSECKKQFYEIKRGALEKRATSLGYGTKMTFENREGVPEAGAYSKLSNFSENVIKRRGNSFGRDDNRSLIDNPQEVRKFPGPGAYISIDEKHKTGFGNTFQNTSYTIRGKYQDPLTRHGNELGPGHYPIDAPISARGTYYNSKYGNSGCIKLGKDERFLRERVEVPGPGKYHGNQKVNLNGTGTYFHSKYQTTKANSFGNSKRPSPAKPNEAPDPGAYWTFSEFALQNKNWSQQY